MAQIVNIDKDPTKMFLSAPYPLGATLAVGPTVQGSDLCSVLLFPTCPSPARSLPAPHLLLVSGGTQQPGRNRRKRGHEGPASHTLTGRQSHILSPTPHCLSCLQALACGGSGLGPLLTVTPLSPQHCLSPAAPRLVWTSSQPFSPLISLLVFYNFSRPLLLF